MSKDRERAYERRRYEEWQTNLAAKKRKRRRTQQVAAAVLSSVAALAVIIGVAFVITSGGDDEDTATPAASTSPSAAPSASATPVAGGCTPSTLQPVAAPKQTDKVPAKSLAAGKTFDLTLATTCGSITLELDGDEAPQAVASTVSLARSGFYDGTPCHRLTTSGIFVLQCGDPTGTGSGGPGYTYGPLENVPKDGVFEPGDVAMARAQSPDSQGSQFFLVYEKTTLDPASTGGGYTKIGKITKGLSVVKKVAKSGATPDGDGAPVTPVSITSAKVSEG